LAGFFLLPSNFAIRLLSRAGYLSKQFDPGCMKRIVFLFLPIALFGTTPPVPNLTKEKLIGVWEAAMGPEFPAMTGIYRMEIRSESDGYLVAVFADILPNAPNHIISQFSCKMTACELKDGKLKICFANLAPQDPDARFTLEGTAVGADDFGSIVGKFTTSGSRYLLNVTYSVWFQKGVWTREFRDASIKAEKCLQKVRETGKIPDDM
ncbi:MAG TPA: hypothetical protein VGQ70_02605, partial [Candidatus Udaeobacter sp.]|nr:hypothetical protein [Candidatus Udaeobacter sp.]